MIWDGQRRTGLLSLQRLLDARSRAGPPNRSTLGRAIQDNRRCAHQVRLHGMKMKEYDETIGDFLKLRMFTALDLEFESSLEAANRYR